MADRDRGGRRSAGEGREHPSPPLPSTSAPVASAPPNSRILSTASTSSRQDAASLSDLVGLSRLRSLLIFLRALLATVRERWGWSPESIEIVDDLGTSASAPGLRRGFENLLQRIRRDEVGAVAVSDASRLVRNPWDWGVFAVTARQHDTLFFHGDQLV